MIRPTQSRAPRSILHGLAWLACCLAMAATSGSNGQAQTAEPVQGTESAQPKTSDVSKGMGSLPGPTVSKHQARAADEAYLAGAKKLEHNDIVGAQLAFEQAQQLNPANGNYAIAISVAREHRVGDLVQRASKARLGGDDKTAETLLAAARSIDPDSLLVAEHSGQFVRQSADARQGAAVGASAQNPPNEGARIPAGAHAGEGWQMQAPVLAGAVRLEPNRALKTFDLRGSSADVLRNVAMAYGIHVVVDTSMEPKTLRFNLQNANYEQAMGVALDMAHAFAVPLDKSSVIVAMDSPDNRDRLERQVEETIFLPGLTTEQINDLAQVVRSIFDVKQASIERGLGSIILRAPQDVLDPLNVTLKDLIDGTGEVMIEVKLYEVDHTNSLDAGAAIPTQFTAFNVDQAANEIVNSNQTLVQQAVAQGYVTAGTSNLEIALALIQLGLVHSDLATNLIGVFGGGLLKTGISGATNATFNLGLNSSDTRTLDDVQLRVGEHEQAIFREGLKYPIALSTYSSGVSGAGSALGNASINGVSLASLIAPFTGGGSTTIPQITYEDLGVTLNATPVIEKSGRINLLLDLKLEALSGGSLNGNPILNSRRFATELTVADGESALMVSDVNKDESDAITGLPGLSELPGFQTPLDGTRERDNSQLVVVVTPHVVRRRSSVIAGPRIPMPPLPDE